MIAFYITAFSLAFLISFLLTPLVRRLALRIGAVDKPSRRKVHSTPVPRLGGLAIVVAIIIPFLILGFERIDRPLLGLLAGLTILLVVGTVDDIKRLPAKTKLIWQIVAALVVLSGGIGIVSIGNPFNGVIRLDEWRIPFEIWGFGFNILPIANAVSILWIVGLINAVNLMDGLDGLAGGVSAIAALVLFIIAISPATANLTVALFSIIMLGALLGFLPHNFFPSNIFMGDSGAYVIGLLLALLSIYNGSKITIGALVLGLAIVDMLWAIARRLVRRQSPFKSDRGHLHHLLLDSGLLSHRRVVILIYVVTVIIAATILLAGGLAAFTLMVLFLIALVSFLRIISPYRQRRL